MNSVELKYWELKIFMLDLNAFNVPVTDNYNVPVA